MHLLIPFAAPLSDAGRQALGALALPRLASLLALADKTGRDEGDELSLSPPHERALARTLGWTAADGRLPWAAWLAAADGIATGEQAWALLTPAQWLVGTEQVSLADPAALRLDDAASRALLGAVQELFTSEGFAIEYGAPTRWYAAHHSLAELALASPDRVIGRNVDRWLGGGPAARPIRRLQNEVQMLLHQHPLNAAREASGLPPVNSLWISGCGRAWPVTGAAATVDARLRGPALADDWPAWVEAWAALDAGPLEQLLGAARQGRAVRLTLCGERSSRSFEVAAPGRWRRLAARWRRPALRPLLEAL